MARGRFKKEIENEVEHLEEVQEFVRCIYVKDGSKKWVNKEEVAAELEAMGWEKE